MRQLTRLLRYVAPYWWQLLSSVLLMAAVGLLDAFRVLLIGPIFDRVLNPGSPSREMQLFRVPITGTTVDLQQFVPSHFHNPWPVVAFALVAATVLKGIFDYAGTYLVNYAGFGMITDLRNELYNSILRRSAAFYQRHTTGTLISTIVNDIERVQFAMSSVLAEFLQQLFTLIFTAFVVVLLGGKLAWVLLLFVPFIIYSAGKIGRRVRHTTRRGQDKLADIQNILHETITGNRIVKAFSMESWEIARFAKAAQRLFRANLRSVAAAAISSPLMDIVGAIAIALLLLLGREQMKHQMFTAGTFLRSSSRSSNSTIQCVSLPCSIIISSRRWARRQKFSSSWILRTTSGKSRERSPSRHFPKTSDSKDVCFSYETDGDESREILCDINLEVRAGEVVAVVGSSGAGKSTLVHLIPRFFDVTAGRLLIDGRDVRDTTLASLRSQIGVVTQETVLFNDTLRNNIAYGQPSISQKQVEAAARAALAHDFIMGCRTVTRP